MSCGCKAQPVALTRDGRAIRPDWQTHAAMCSVCHRCDDWQKQVTGNTCPRGWAPSSGAHVTWAGAVWRGVPMPIRVWLAIRLRRPALIRKLPGCGCLHRVKTYIETMTATARKVV